MIRSAAATAVVVARAGGEVTGLLDHGDLVLRLHELRGPRGQVDALAASEGVDQRSGGVARVPERRRLRQPQLGGSAVRVVRGEHVSGQPEAARLLLGDELVDVNGSRHD